ncbi:unnamed protein product [Sphenostylis stenocarpa]|uniref:C-JID domain-containing protein n=1 Tax=Sphenostylis stenocarpa TaxID=92480 RepID=A0AA86W6C2_9FABA|nr:unnamed protein product [Sphenostylis stenocarpa]
MDDTNRSGVHAPSFLFHSFYIFLCRKPATNAALWLFKGTHLYECLSLDVGSIVPGSDIPRWFNNNHVSKDNSIIIDASPVTDDNYWIGVVCCVIFQMRDITSQSETSSWSGYDIPVNFTSDLDESDHKWLFYLTQQDFINQRYFEGMPNIDGLKLKIKINDIKSFSHDCVVSGEEDPWYEKFCLVEVKKYGYRWVSEQEDLELSNSTVMHGGNLITHKRKFLAMEENK